MSANPYLPKPARITHINLDVEGVMPIRTFRMEFLDPNDWFDFKCGQCAMVTVFGKGEAMFSISSSPYVKDHLQFSIIKTGRVTTELHGMKEGDIVGIRGPYGNHFPLEDWHGKNIYFFGGGCGLAPVWSVLTTALNEKDDFGELNLICGGRTPGDILYMDEIEGLKGRISVCQGVRASFDNPDLHSGGEIKPDNAIGVTCGPPVMIKFVIEKLQSIGFKDEQIFTTIENKMKCGIGKCGRCNVGKDYLCTKGPIYSWAQLKDLPQEY